MADPQDMVLRTTSYTWRCWNLHPEPKDVHDRGRDLTDVSLTARFSGGHRWTRVTEADCNQDPYAQDKDIHGWGPSNRPEHLVPVEKCNCGLFGFANLEDLYIHTQLDHLEPVFGCMKFYGRIHFHQNGIRAQYAQPVHLVLNPSVAEFSDPDTVLAYTLALKRNYDVDVVCMTPMDFFKAAKAQSLPFRVLGNVDTPLDLREAQIPTEDARLDEIDWDAYNRGKRA